MIKLALGTLTALTAATVALPLIAGGGPATPSGTPPCAENCSGAYIVGEYALPIDRSIIDAHPTMIDQPHHDYPAIDLMVPTGSNVYAVHAGTIARIVNWPHNCREVSPCEQTCGIGVSIDGDDGARWIYCHGSQLADIHLSQHVAAGQQLMRSGNTGNSSGPHLHFEIRVDGVQKCPQPLLRALMTRGSSPPKNLPDGGCST